MSWGGVNFLSVIIAAIASMALGAVWYGALAKPWMAAAGLTMDDIKGNTGKPKSSAAYPVAMLSKLVMAFCFARLLALVDAVSVSNGIALALFLWIGFVITSLSVGHRFQLRPWSLTLIDGGYWLAVLLVMGIVIGWIG
jgi:hypothetical protein